MYYAKFYPPKKKIQNQNQTNVNVLSKQEEILSKPKIKKRRVTLVEKKVVLFLLKKKVELYLNTNV